MALFFHSDEVDELIPLKEAVRIAEGSLRDLGMGRGKMAANAPRKRLHIHQISGERPYDTVLNIYAGGSSAYGS